MLVFVLGSSHLSRLFSRRWAADVNSTLQTLAESTCICVMWAFVCFTQQPAAYTNTHSTNLNAARGFEYDRVTFTCPPADTKTANRRSPSVDVLICLSALCVFVSNRSFYSKVKTGHNASRLRIYLLSPQPSFTVFSISAPPAAKRF